MTVRVPKELTENDPSVLAPAAGLAYVPDRVPGLRREQLGNGDEFHYLDESGVNVGAETTARLDALAIPPAWIEVWICPDPNGYLQASGEDAAGRKQYRYHDDYRAFAEQRKFERLHYFGRAVVEVRKAVAEAFERPLGDRDRSIAAAVRLIDAHLLRVGNRRSAESGHYGATTLTVEHIDACGHVELDYVAKSGKERTIIVDDDDLTDILVELAADADNELFWFCDDRSNLRRATATDVNRFIVEHAGEAFSARDFRTWGGSRAALVARAEGKKVLHAIDEAAAELGNTRAVARSSYVHPAVLTAEQSEVERVWNASRTSRWRDRGESALMKLLASE